MGLKKRILLSLLSICIVVFAGSAGYFVLFNDQVSLMDCLYMTVISLTTVGYGEVIQISGNPAAQLFTICLIISGMGVILYGISIVTAAIIEGELTGIIRTRRMLKQIKGLTGHIIVCGGGKTGRPVVEELNKNRKPIVLIETSADHLAACRAVVPELLFLEADATDDDILVSAGIERAAGIVITLPSDKDNLYITMTSRMMNPHIRIIARMTDRKIEPKLIKAGADRVVSPNRIGALRLASEMIRPTVVDFLDTMLRSGQGDLRINQLTIPAGSSLIGCALSHLGLKSRFRLMLMGLKPQGGGVEFDPPHDTLLPGACTLIVMGRSGDVQAAERWLKKQD